MITFFCFQFQPCGLVGYLVIVRSRNPLTPPDHEGVHRQQTERTLVNVRINAMRIDTSSDPRDHPVRSKCLTVRLDLRSIGVL